MRAFLDQLTEHILVTCPPGTSLTVLGYGHGATAASGWLAGNRFPYEQLVFCAAIFPPQINRTRLFAGLPRAPVLVVDTTAEEGRHQTDSTDLLQDLRHARLPARLSRVEAGPLPLAILDGGGQPDDWHPHE